MTQIFETSLIIIETKPIKNIYWVFNKVYFSYKI